MSAGRGAPRFEPSHTGGPQTAGDKCSRKTSVAAARLPAARRSRVHRVQPTGHIGCRRGSCNPRGSGGAQTDVAAQLCRRLPEEEVQRAGRDGRRGRVGAAGRAGRGAMEVGHEAPQQGGTLQATPPSVTRRPSAPGLKRHSTAGRRTRNNFGSALPFEYGYGWSHRRLAAAVRCGHLRLLSCCGRWCDSTCITGRLGGRASLTRATDGAFMQGVLGWVGEGKEQAWAAQGGGAAAGGSSSHAGATGRAAGGCLASGRTGASRSPQG